MGIAGVGALKPAYEIEAIRRKSYSVKFFRPFRGSSEQTGAVLLVMLTFMVLIGSSALLAGLNRSVNNKLVAEHKTAQALAEAKAALISYAVNYYEAYPGDFGFLPCPDLDATYPPAEGGSNGTCLVREVSALGRLPWKSLGLPPLRDGAGECLWYFVSGSYKNSSSSKTNMLNDDTNGAIEVFAADGNTMLLGNTPAERAVAVVIAPGTALDGQDRTDLSSGTEICGGNFSPDNYLECIDIDDGEPCDGATINSINNAMPSGSADTVEQIISAKDESGLFNDRVLSITQNDVFDAVKRRKDFADKVYDESLTPMNLTRAVAECIARYAATNSGAPANASLPWAAPVDLDGDYREDIEYDDETAVLSGRVPRIVGDSNTETGNTVGNILTDCPPYTSSLEIRQLWRNWKDHLFYAVSNAHQPSAGPTPACSSDACLQVNGSGDYAAIVMFVGERLAGQDRNAVPDPDTKNLIINYLENRNASNHPNASGDQNYESGSPNSSFNDVLYCIESPSLAVAQCPI